MPALGMLSFEPIDDLQAALEHPLSHAISVGVIIGVLMKLVGADYLANMVALVVAALRSRGPEARQLKQHLRACAQEKLLVLRGVPVLPEREGDIRRDMMLLDAGQNFE